ncbi:unnamed protein product [Clonostachys rosea f. rosea IK726]|uniref:Mitochondrial thiamine pyrophosphate carrier 1 n=3 Tax=Bionectria ochroleuca TaxID=29856 RepID=A0A0B7K1J4_BIOOC|nr:unnamed protein product [Clonostachys rosea f. rosea IK726]
MSPTSVVSELGRGLEESQNQRDARIEELWFRLDPGRTGELDFKALREGFRRIDHPLKNADQMLKKILAEVDTNGDGRIQYEEFHTFVDRADRQLYKLFRSIDKDGNGKLDEKELQTAFRGAGLTVSNRRLAEFFKHMDDNDDGFVSFDEWRHFLLFMPAQEHDSHLDAMLSFYNSVTFVTPEGDSVVSEETLEGLGTAGPPCSSRSLLHSILGSILRVAFPGGYTPSPQEPASRPAATGVANSELAASSLLGNETKAIDGRRHVAPGAGAAPVGQKQHEREAVGERIVSDDTQATHQESSSTASAVKTRRKFELTEFIPDPGYFLAGAVAGGVSRTATAPLDRLKVYLLVNTGTGSANAAKAINSVASGRPLGLVKNALRPFSDAIRDLFRSGGIKGFFAGNGLNVIKIMPETAIKFGSYEAAKRTLANLEGHGDPKKLSSVSKFSAGGMAGMIAQFCVYPLDTLKFRLQCETVKDGLTGSALVRQTAVKMYKDGGLRACYRGVTMGLVGMFPYSAIDMGMFEFLKNTYRTTYAKYTGCHEDDAAPGNIAMGMIGATSGAIGASLVYPLNVVRTRLQTQGTAMHSATYTGIWDVTRKTIQREGYRGLYKGLTPNLLKVAPALSITWVVYENTKKALGLS